MNQDRPEQMQQEEQEEALKAQIRELEQDLAQTKLKMVEAKCRIQVRAGNKAGAALSLSKLVLAGLSRIQSLSVIDGSCGHGLVQELEHEKGILANDLQEAKNSWISKAFTSLRTSGGGGLQGISIHRDGAPSLGLNLHGSSLSGWSSKKFSWPHKENRGNVS